MQTAGAAAIYARISSDGEGTGLGVTRQVEDCRRLAESLGWTVAEEYVDNDVSAFSGKVRPQYQRMLADLADGRRDAVLIYHVDRLMRRPIELEEFVATVEAVKPRPLVRFVVGDMNIGNGDGLMVARIMAAMAANESATKSRRLRRKHEQIAAAGRPNGGSRRPFGYDDDKVTVREDEAAIFRTLVARYLGGENTRSLAKWLEAEGIKTVFGTPWRTTTLRDMLLNPRYAGLRAHKGVVVGPAVWEAIITEDEHRRVLARFADRKTSTRRDPTRYALSGLLRCGKCGSTLFSSRRDQYRRRYVCLSGPDHGGCGKLTVVADPVERLIADYVLYRLDSAEVADALAGRTAHDEQMAALAARLDEDTEQLSELAEAYGRREVTMREWMAAKKPIEKRIADAQRRLSRATNADALAGLVGNGDALRAQWSTLNLARQHAIITALLDHAVIAPGTPGARTLDPDRVQPVWRL